MDDFTRTLWAKQNQHDGDRHRLFAAIADAVEANNVLYPGSYVDVAASFVWPCVTYVEMDKRAARFFEDADGVAEIVAANAPKMSAPDITFIASDYTADLGLEDESFDLLVSLYAGFISESCTRYLRVGGSLLVNPSHGDAAMASIDDRYEFSGAVLHRSGKYSVRSDDLERYLVPKKPLELTRELLHETGRGLGYTTPAFAYLFTRVQ